MADLPLGHADYHRSVAKSARVRTLNRYYEANPVLTAGGTAMLARPALRRFLNVGDGPVRGVYSQSGDFNDALFVVSGNSWYRVEKDGKTVTLITAGVKPGLGAISMVGTGTIGDVPEYMWMADGRNLWLYMANSYAKATISGSPAVGDVIMVGTTYYQFTAGSVDAGTPAGTLANPYLVAHSFVDSISWQTFIYAIGAKGEEGTDYSTGLVANPVAQALDVDTESATVRANAVGALGNDVPVSETGAGIAWTAATLTGGGAPTVTTVATPDDVAPISLGYSASYVVVIPAQGEGVNGRFWWIEPGETSIDPLDFATAERAPDPVFQVIVFGDQFWLPGSTTTEVYFFSGNPDTPVQRLQGVSFDRGTWEGTAVAVKESMIIVDSDGGVFQIQGGLKPIGNPAIAERIRESIQKQASRVIL